MMLLDIGVQIILVSISGVFSPGPLFFVNLVLSKHGGFWSGIKIAIGHTIVELPVIILYSIPIIIFSSLNVTFSIIRIISFVGGISLIAFGILYVVKTLTKDDNHPYIIKRPAIRNPVLVGIIFMGANPFFFLWWFSVGFKLIADSVVSLGYPFGVVFLFLVHIWLDYAWLGFSSFLASRGIKLINLHYHKLMIVLLTVPLFYYGINFIISAIK